MDGNARLIYEGGVKYNEKEEKSIDSFLNYIKDNHLELFESCLPPNIPTYKFRSMILKNLYASKFNLQEAYQKMKDYHIWRSNHIPMEISDKTIELIVILIRKMDSFLVLGVINLSGLYYMVILIG